MNDSALITIEANPKLNTCRILLPASKSESNRALIINQFAQGDLHNLSAARDTATMIKLLESQSSELDVLDAGTTMRFLLAYFALTNQRKTLTGTERMCERPIGILVEALQSIGAEINYERKSGYPPVQTISFPKQLQNHISIRGDVSSQYISALMMLAPTLPEGLIIELVGEVASKPYINMTLELMRQFGVSAQFERDRLINIPHGTYQSNSYKVESDWSGSSYWYAFVALSEKAEITLEGLKEHSFQGDRQIVEIMDQLGVKTRFTNSGIVLTKKESHSRFEYDFRDCPDLAQTVCVICAAKGIAGEFTGLKSLRIKETDRIAALQNELSKIGASLEECNSELWKLHPAASVSARQPIKFDTYDDHRMAMAFAPLATLIDIEIQHPEVVNKSYPGFWDDMKKAGFIIN